MISVKADTQLICPECGEDVTVPEARRALGRRVRCEHCGVESYLNHYRESVSEPMLWRLQSTLPEEEDRKAG
ncbi:MAG TPA: hypothetical protein VKT74_02605 [Gammaproteobacteria bacterium]|nr:hypothetical protein [Gammaproteobacteria bacterium]